MFKSKHWRHRHLAERIHRHFDIVEVNTTFIWLHSYLAGDFRRFFWTQRQVQQNHGCSTKVLHFSKKQHCLWSFGLKIYMDKNDKRKIKVDFPLSPPPTILKHLKTTKYSRKATETSLTHQTVQGESACKRYLDSVVHHPLHRYQCPHLKVKRMSSAKASHKNLDIKFKLWPHCVHYINAIQYTSIHLLVHLFIVMR